jgi:hypothetical protein
VLDPARFPTVTNSRNSDPANDQDDGGADRQNEETFDDNAWDAVEVAKRIARRLLTVPGILPRQIATIAKAIHVLDCMPNWIISGSLSFGVEYRAGDADFREMRYYQVEIDSEALRFESGGSVYDRAVGSDNLPGRSIELSEDGKSRGIGSLSEWEDSFEEFVRIGGEVTSTEDNCDDLVMAGD